MARRGAKRKNRGYTPGHKPVNDPVDVKDLGTPELQAQRSRCVGEAYIRAWDGSLLHAWYLRREIAKEQYEAGRKWSSLVKRYRTMICAPSPDQGPGTKSPFYEHDPDEFEKVTGKYQAAFEAMTYNQARAVSQVLRDACDPWRFEHAKAGLTMLAKHWGL